MLERFIDLADALNRRIGHALAWSLPAMTAVTLLVVLLGTVFRVGWVWMGEIVVYLHGMLFMLGAGYTLLHDGHVRIDLFYSKMPPARRAWVNLLGVLLLLLPTCAMIFAYSFSYVMASWAVLEHSPERQGLPAVFLLKTCLLLMPLLLAVSGLSLAAKSYLQLRGGAGAGDAS